MATLLELMTKVAKAQAPKAQSSRAQTSRAQASGEVTVFDFLEREGWHAGERGAIWRPPYNLTLDGVTHLPVVSMKLETWTVPAVKAAIARFTKEFRRVRSAIDALYVAEGVTPPKTYEIDYNHGIFYPDNLPHGRQLGFSWEGGGGGGHTVSASRLEDAVLQARAKGIIFSSFRGVEGSSRRLHKPLVFDEVAGFRLPDDGDVVKDVVCAKCKGGVFAFTARERKAENYYCPRCDKRGGHVVRDPTLDWLPR